MPAEASVDLSQQDWMAIDKVLRAHVPNRAIFIFGSRVTGLARPDSDLDLAIAGDGPLRFDEHCLINDAFEQLGLNFKIDLIDLHDARGVFRKRIESEWIPWEQAKLTRIKAVA